VYNTNTQYKMKNKKHAPAYILIFKTRQFYYDTHTVRAKHASVDALTSQESCIKFVRRVVSVREETIVVWTPSKSLWFTLSSVDHADRGKKLPVEEKEE